jgi:hypothetical protein
MVWPETTMDGVKSALNRLSGRSVVLLEMINNPIDSSFHRVPLFVPPTLSVRAGRAGRGVFTEVAIQKGTPITFYPHHGWRRRGDRYLRTQDGVRLDEIHCTASGSYHEYGVENIDGPISWIYGSPTRTDDPLFLGHMLNDPSGDMLEFDELDQTEQDRALQRYMLRTLDANVRSWTSPTNTVVMYASKDIAAGSELLFSYGAPYWTDGDHAAVFKIMASWPPQKRLYLISRMFQ